MLGTRPRAGPVRPSRILHPRLEFATGPRRRALPRRRWRPAATLRPSKDRLHQAPGPGQAARGNHFPPAALRRQVSNLAAQAADATPVTSARLFPCFTPASVSQCPRCRRSCPYSGHHSRTGAHHAQHSSPVSLRWRRRCALTLISALIWIDGSHAGQAGGQRERDARPRKPPRKSEPRGNRPAASAPADPTGQPGPRHQALVFGRASVLASPRPGSASAAPAACVAGRTEAPNGAGTDETGPRPGPPPIVLDTPTGRNWIAAPRLSGTPAGCQRYLPAPTGGSGGHRAPPGQRNPAGSPTSPATRSCFNAPEDPVAVTAASPVRRRPRAPAKPAALLAARRSWPLTRLAGRSRNRRPGPRPWAPWGWPASGSAVATRPAHGRLNPADRHPAGAGSSRRPDRHDSINTNSATGQAIGKKGRQGPAQQPCAAGDVGHEPVSATENPEKRQATRADPTNKPSRTAGRSAQPAPDMVVAPVTKCQLEPGRRRLRPRGVQARGRANLDVARKTSVRCRVSRLVAARRTGGGRQPAASSARRQLFGHRARRAAGGRRPSARAGKRAPPPGPRCPRRSPGDRASRWSCP